jgi:hypothetical protein
VGGPTGPCCWKCGRGWCSSEARRTGTLPTEGRRSWWLCELRRRAASRLSGRGRPWGSEWRGSMKSAVLGRPAICLLCGDEMAWPLRASRSLRCCSSALSSLVERGRCAVELAVEARGRTSRVPSSASCGSSSRLRLLRDGRRPDWRLLAPSRSLILVMGPRQRSSISDRGGSEDVFLI